MKICGRCKQEKYAVDFSKHLKRPDGLNYVCRACHKKHRDDNRAQYIEKQKRYREKNREFLRAKGREYVRTNVSDEVRQYRRNKFLKNTYGVTDAWYRDTLKMQGGVCAICKEDKKRPRDRHLHVDHDHASKLVRGILCQDCNQGLGRFTDSPALLRSAADYLELHQQKEKSCA